MNILALPMMTKAVIALGIALALSLGGNFLLVRSAWVKHGEDKAAAQVQKLEAEAEGFRQAAAISDALAKQGDKDHEALVGRLETIAKGMEDNQSRSQRVTRANPLPPNCVPGTARMDSVNQTLGAKKER